MGLGLAVSTLHTGNGWPQVRTRAGLNTGVTCDAIGCIGRLADGRLASMALEVEAFAENCAR
ncbi:MAG: hypothetical protein WCC43_00260, partial [Pseudolabrys sp.]